MAIQGKKAEKVDIGKHGRKGKDNDWPGCTEEFANKTNKRREKNKAAKKSRKKNRKK